MFKSFNHIKEIQNLMATQGYITRPTHQCNTTNPKKIPKLIQTETFWKDDLKCYMTVSPRYRRYLGIGKTSQEAEGAFYDILSDYYSSRTSKNKGGRPKKGNITVTYHIPESVRDYIDQYCYENKINQGQFITDLIKLYQTNYLKT